MSKYKGKMAPAIDLKAICGLKDKTNEEDDDNLSSISHSVIRDIDPFEADSDGLQALVEIRLEDYKEARLQDHALWDTFKNDFEAWTKEMWDKLGQCSLKTDMRNFVIANGISLLIHYGGKAKVTISGSLVDLAHKDEWPPITQKLIDWGTMQGYDMDSPAIRRIENGDSAEFSKEELLKIRDQRRSIKAAKSQLTKSLHIQMHGNHEQHSVPENTKIADRNIPQRNTNLRPNFYINDVRNHPEFHRDNIN